MYSLANTHLKNNTKSWYTRTLKSKLWSNNTSNDIENIRYRSYNHSWTKKKIFKKNLFKNFIYFSFTLRKCCAHTLGHKYASVYDFNFFYFLLSAIFLFNFFGLVSHNQTRNKDYIFLASLRRSLPWDDNKIFRDFDFYFEKNVQKKVVNGCYLFFIRHISLITKVVNERHLVFIRHT